MIWNGDIGLELYVATEAYKGKNEDKNQYEESLRALRIIENSGLGGRIEIITLGRIEEQKPFFDIIKGPKVQAKLPFLVSAHACMTGAVLGHSGLEEITEALQSIGLIK